MIIRFTVIFIVFVLIGSPPGKATIFLECANPGTLPGLPSFP